MSIPIHQLDPKTRGRRGIGNFSLAVGLLLWFFRAYIPVNQGWLQTVCGLPLGASIAINLFGLRAACGSSAIDR
ncbi:MAG: hypothetical protein ABR924_00790 [Terracidiphilus sp.]